MKIVDDPRISEILYHYGSLSQIIKAIEEMAELTQSLTKYEDVEHIKEEIADVSIMISQLTLLFGKDDIEKVIDYKLKRQLKRMKGNKNE